MALPQLGRAIEQAALVHLPEEKLRAARERHTALEEAEVAARQARRRELGLGSVEPPAEFMCPITYEVMEDPVCTADGHTYERREIFRWLCKHDTSPLTGAPLPNKALTPNIGLRQVIAAWRAEHPEVEDV